VEEKAMRTNMDIGSTTAIVRTGYPWAMIGQTIRGRRAL